MKQILIISDGRKGHVNQSIAFCNYKGLEYDIVEVHFKYKIYKMFSYLFDRVGFYTITLFGLEERFKNKLRMTNNNHPELVTGSIDKHYLIVCAGSSTYYAAKVIAKKLNTKSVAMMLPKGYRYNFDVIFAQTHDNSPNLPNIIKIPANFSYMEPGHIYHAKKKSIGIIIGGNNKILLMSSQTIKKQLDAIAVQYPDYEIAITTSPRTPKEIEELVQTYNFDYELIYSKSQLNPISDFLYECETVFITSDSTSMISEAVSYGKSNVVVLPLDGMKNSKFERLITFLEYENYIYIFDGKIKHKNRKIDFISFAQKVGL
ncbi:MAG: ELM1/GtrOC1 family putative glycosyltransferase [Sulfurovaceae bacterium]|nr:ELM1/GtrOC1 family putative glycosyltransferase [Sulfurovaceae bacterium]